MESSDNKKKKEKWFKSLFKCDCENCKKEKGKSKDDKNPKRSFYYSLFKGR